MKKNYNSTLFESTYKAVMNAIGKEVRSMLNESDCDNCECDDDIYEYEYCDDCDDDIEECGDIEECDDLFDECYENRRQRRNLFNMNEMARAAVKRTINPKSLANVRDAIMNHKYNEEWATNVKPNAKLNDVELLHRYVAALMIFHKDCPKTEEEIDEIGIFKNYAHQLLDGSGTLEDIQTLYNEQSPLGVRSRQGRRNTSRVAKGYRDNTETPAATVETPSDDFDFDAEVNNTNNDNAVEEPAKDYPDYDDVPVEAEDEVVPEIEDNADLDNEEDDDEYIDYDIDNIQSITAEQFEDKRMNKAFVEFNDDYIFSNGKQIGFEIEITDPASDDDETLCKLNVWGDTFADALKKLAIITQSSMSSYQNNYFLSIDKAPVINEFYKHYFRVADEDVSDDVKDAAEDFMVDCFIPAKTVNDVIEYIKEYLKK